MERVMSDRYPNRPAPYPPSDGLPPGKQQLTPEQQVVIADLKDRFRPAPLPLTPEIHDMSTAADQTLEDFGLPPRPPQIAREHHALWMATFARKMRFSPFEFAEEQLLAETFEPDFRRSSYGPAVPGYGSGRIGGSQNWSGAYTEPSDGRTFAQVWGQFNVPVVQPPDAAVTPGPGKTSEYHCATWIGLDGQRRYFDSSLPQIGTDQYVTVDSTGAPTPSTRAWVQWWARDDDGSVNGIGPVPIPKSCFPVEQGDQIGCILQVVNQHHVRLIIINYTPKSPDEVPNVVVVCAKAPTATLPGGIKRQYTVTGATAEWVMERPMDLESHKLQGFPIYATTKFISCFAMESFDGNSHLVFRDLSSPKFIRMFEVDEQTECCRYLSIPERIDDLSFQVTYGDSG
jgi:hypothetical protein